MEEHKQIVYISVDKISGHPDNPRKDLGDLEELAESIKVKGIMQNLTVVPWFSSITYAPADNGGMDGYYIVVIGHRRLSAAKLAGLTEVPCIISNMDLREQVATMLLENMQRSDLTAYEEAQGFQMMLNLGESLDTISEKTGFSESTVRRRMKLLELDKEDFQEAAERGATLMDFAELEKISDPEIKNEVLKSVGTDNFNWKLKNGIENEKKKIWLENALKQIGAFATEVEDTNGLKHVKSIWHCGADEIKKPEGEGPFYYKKDSYYIFIYTEYPNIEDSTEEKKERANRAEEQKNIRRENLRKETELAFRLRYEFIKDYSKAKKSINGVFEFITRAAFITNNSYNQLDDEDFIRLLGLSIDVNDEEFECVNFEMIEDKFKSFPEKVALVAAYCSICDTPNTCYFDWKLEHSKNDELDQLYDALIKIGYRMSDSEKALRDGTHKLFEECVNED